MKLDLLPRFVEIRLHDSKIDYTNTGRPGVFLLEPKNAEWVFGHAQEKTINHPNSPAPVLQKGKKVYVGIKSSQLPLAPAGVGTYNNCQGKTAKNELGVPIGHTIDLHLLHRDEESWAHYYMILGRATSLATTLLVNFPRKEGSDELDWSWLEDGPPEYMTRVFDEMKQRYLKTRRLVEDTCAPSMLCGHVLYVFALALS